MELRPARGGRGQALPRLWGGSGVGTAVEVAGGQHCGKQPPWDGSRGAGPGLQARTSPCTLRPGANTAPRQRSSGVEEAGCRACQHLPSPHSAIPAAGPLFLGAGGMTTASVVSWTVPPHTHTHTCVSGLPVYEFSHVLTQEPPQNPGTATRILLSHFTDEEIDSERLSDLRGVT